ncbi:uncharacterized protein LOC144430761 [Styela clava]
MNLTNTHLFKRQYCTMFNVAHSFRGYFGHPEYLCPVNDTGFFLCPPDYNRRVGEIISTAIVNKNKKRTRFTIDAILGNESEDEKHNPSKRRRKSNESSVNNPDTSVDSGVISNFDSESSNSSSFNVYEPHKSFDSTSGRYQAVSYLQKQQNDWKVAHYDSPNIDNMISRIHSGLLHSTPEPMAQYKQFHPDMNGSFTLSPIGQDSKYNMKSQRIRNTSETKVKRSRTVFTNKQLERLEKEFSQQRYLVGKDRTALAKVLKLGEAQIKVWFQNRRIKFRKQMCKESPVIVDDN